MSVSGLSQSLKKSLEFVSHFRRNESQSGAMDESDAFKMAMSCALVHLEQVGSRVCASSQDGGPGKSEAFD